MAHGALKTLKDQIVKKLLASGIKKLTEPVKKWISQAEKWLSNIEKRGLEIVRAVLQNVQLVKRVVKWIRSQKDAIAKAKVEERYVLCDSRFKSSSRNGGFYFR